MHSTLGSVLCARKITSVCRVRDALTAQVLLGGSLDTALLEAGGIDEQSLIAAIAAATGYAPMEPGLIDVVDRSLAALIPRSRAREIGIAPISQRDGRLLVLCTAETDPIGLSELAFELGREIVPRAATELRMLQARAITYDGRPGERYRRLLAIWGWRPETRLRAAA